MKRPALFLALAALGGAVAGRVVVAPAPSAVLCVCAALGAAAAAVGARAKGPSAEKLHPTVIRLLLAALFCLVFFLQNEVVRRERLGAAQVKDLSRLGPVRFRGAVADEPVGRGGGRILMILRDVDIEAPVDRALQEALRTKTGADDRQTLMAAQELAESGVRSAARPPRAQERKPPSSFGKPRRLACRLQVLLSGEAARSFAESPPVRGQRMEIRGEVAEPPVAAHPDLFDYRAYLHAYGIGGLATASAASDARRVPGEDRRAEAALFGVLIQWRRSTLRLFDAALTAPVAAVMRAMLLGDMSRLDQPTRDAFTRIGGSHLFSVSGLHTTFLALMIFFFCRMVQMPLRTTAWVTTACLAVYCALVGFLAPVVRASIMAFCMMAPYLSRRAVDSLNALCIAVFLTVLFSPLSPYQVDFQFSYLCVLGLITLMPVLNELLLVATADRPYRGQRVIAFYNYWIVQGISIVAASQLAVLPLLSIYYHQFSLVALLANLVMVPYASLVFGAGWILSVLGPLAPAAAAGVGAAASGISNSFLWLADVFAAVPGAAVSLPALPWWLIGLYYCLLFSGPHMFMRRAPGQREIRRGRMLVRLAAIAALVAWWPLISQWATLTGTPAGDFEVTMLDVGQGDSLLLRFPNGKTLLIDAGPRPAVRTIRQYLNAKGINGLSALLATHSDSDHIGGAPDLIEAVRVGRLVTGPARSTSQTQARLDQAVARRHVPVTQVARGMHLAGVPSVQLDILNPPADPNAATDGAANNQSVVLLAEYGSVRFLFTGDAEALAERDMVESFGGAHDAADAGGAGEGGKGGGGGDGGGPGDALGLAAEVLKVSHHGSNVSTTQGFLEAVRPRVSLLSVGAKNSYGHPAPAVVERLERAGCAIWSTALDGAVEMRTDGRRLWVRACREPTP